MPTKPLAKNRGHRGPHRDGFTLIELLAVLAIIGILAALVLSVSMGARNRAAVDLTRSELAVLGTALEEYRRIYHGYPQGTDESAFLVALNGNGVRPPFLDLGAFRLSEDGTALVDPWDNAYVYMSENFGIRRGYRLYSLGPDGGEGNVDGVDMDLDNVTVSR